MSHKGKDETFSQAKYQIERLRREVDQWYGPKNDAYKMKQIDLATAEKLLWQAEKMEKKYA